MERKTYILIGRTNPYQAQRSGLFRGRTLIAADQYWMNAEEASEKMMAFCCEESDNYSYNDDGTAVLYGNDVVMTHGNLSYDHDGYVWSMVPVDELDHDEAKAALAYGLWIDAEKTIYAIHEDLRPEPSIED
jgi:hypothetical protein